MRLLWRCAGDKVKDHYGHIYIPIIRSTNISELISNYV